MIKICDFSYSYVCTHTHSCTHRHVKVYIILLGPPLLCEIAFDWSIQQILVKGLTFQERM